MILGMSQLPHSLHNSISMTGPPTTSSLASTLPQKGEKLPTYPLNPHGCILAPPVMGQSDLKYPAVSSNMNFQLRETNSFYKGPQIYMDFASFSLFLENAQCSPLLFSLSFLVPMWSLEVHSTLPTGNHL
jgi:hypothetical protein